MGKMMFMAYVLWSLPRVPEVCPFFKDLKYPYRECMCLKFLPQFSSHSNETCYT